MTITTYATLKTAIGDFLNRDDLTSVIPTFIQMAEARINRELRHWQMETKTTASASGQYTTLPTDWIETIRLDVDGGPRLQLVSHAEMQAMRADAEDTGGEPCFYAFVAGQIELFPSPDSTYTLNHVYVASITALSADDDTNWLMTAGPELYLYGALLHSAPYLVEDNRQPVWGSLYANALEGLNSTSSKARTSGAMRVKVR